MRVHRALASVGCSLLIPALLVVATPPRVSAGDEEAPSWVALRDPTGDVWRETGDQGHPGHELVKVGFPPADVVRAFVRHGRGAVLLRLRFVDLRRVGMGQSYLVNLRTPGRIGYGLYLDAGRPEVVVGGWRGRLTLEDGDVEDVDCPGLTYRINYATDMVSWRVPRRCLGRPAWVQTTWWTFQLTHTDARIRYFDNPHNRARFARSYTRRLFPGPLT